MFCEVIFAKEITYLNKLRECLRIQCVALCCNVLQRVAVCRFVLLCVSVCCSVLQRAVVPAHPVRCS